MIVDAIIVAFVGFFTWRGLRRGLVGPLVRLLGFIVAVVAAVAGYQALSKPLRSMGVSNGISYIVSALLIFVGVTVLAWFAARALTKLVNFTKWGMVNKAGGAALGAVWALAWTAVVLVAVSYAPNETLHARVKESVLAEEISKQAPHLATAAARADLRRLVVTFLR